MDLPIDSMVDLSSSLLFNYQRVNLHVPMVFLWFFVGFYRPGICSAVLQREHSFSGCGWLDDLPTMSTNWMGRKFNPQALYAICCKEFRTIRLDKNY